MQIQTRGMKHYNFNGRRRSLNSRDQRPRFFFGPMAGWLDGDMAGWRYGWMAIWLDGDMAGWRYGYMYVCMYVCMYGCMHELVALITLNIVF